MSRVVVCAGNSKVKQEDKELIRKAIRDALSYADVLVFSGSAGFDVIALHEAWTWKAFARNQDHREYAAKKMPKAADVKLVVIVPAKIEDQPEIFQKGIGYYQRAAFGSITVAEMALPYSADSIDRRNTAMVDRIGEGDDGSVLAYWNGDKANNAGIIIEYAKSKGIDVCLIEGVVEHPEI